MVNRAERSDVTWAFLGFSIAMLLGRALWLGDPMAIPLHQMQSGALVLFGNSKSITINGGVALKVSKTGNTASVDFKGAYGRLLLGRHLLDGRDLLIRRAVRLQEPAVFGDALVGGELG